LNKVCNKKILEVDEFILRIRKARGEIKKALRKTNEVMKRKADKRQEKAIEYKKGDLV